MQKLQFEIKFNISIISLAMFLLNTWRTTAFGLYGYINFTKNGFLEHAKKFKEDEMQVQVDRKNCIVTGANSGIGYAAADGLASRGATVYMICRNKERGEAALSKIQSATGNPNVHLEIVDLSLQRTYTMTELMLPLLEKAGPTAKVITVSSGGMYSVPLTTDLQFSDEKFDGVEQYARNKRVQVALTEKWAEMYKNKGIGFYSMHPGWAETPGVAKSLPSFHKSFLGKLRTSAEGADTIIWLALQPKEKLVSGGFYFDRAEAPKHLKLAATAHSHAVIDSVIDSLRTMAALSS